MAEIVAKDESYQQKAQRIVDAFFRTVVKEGQEFDGFVRDVFPGYLIVEARDGLQKYAFVEDDNGVIAFASPQKVQMNFVAASASESKVLSFLKSGLRLFGSQRIEKSASNEQDLFTKDVEIKICSDEERTVGGIVLVAGEVDSQNDYWRPEDVRAVALKFMEKYQVVDEMHTFISVATPVESFYFPTEEEGGQATYKLYGREVPAGAWWMTVKVNDNDAWASVKSGKFTGFSIFGIRKTRQYIAKSADTVAKAKELRLMKGDEWDVVAVALVDKPAVKAAQYYVIKRDGLADFIAKRMAGSPNKNEQQGGVVMNNKEKTPGGEATPPNVETVTKADIEGLNTLIADLMATVKSQGEVLTAIVMSLKGVATAEQVTQKMKETGEYSETVAKRVTDLEAALKKMGRTSNALSIESAEKGDKPEDKPPSGAPSWANPSGGPKKK